MDPPSSVPPHRTNKKSGLGSILSLSLNRFVRFDDPAETESVPTVRRYLFYKEGHRSPDFVKHKKNEFLPIHGVLPEG